MLMRSFARRTNFHSLAAQPLAISLARGTAACDFARTLVTCNARDTLASGADARVFQLETACGTAACTFSFCIEVVTLSPTATLTLQFPF